LVAKEELGLASRYKRPPFFLLARDTTPSLCYYLPIFCYFILMLENSHMIEYSHII
jgi:hypothetical protein